MLEEVGSGLACELNAVVSQLLDKFIAGQRPLVGEYSAESADASDKGVFVKAQFGIAASIARNEKGA